MVGGLGLGLAAMGIMILTGAACTTMACCQKNSAVASTHQHGASAAMSAGQGGGAPSAFANTKCPIMGGAIDPAKVPESLTRVYKGKEIAFCCAMCPGQWDKLTDAQKDARLQ